MAKKIYNIIHYILIGIMVLLICGLLIMTINRYFNKDKNTKFFGYYLFEVVSWSMYNEEDEDSIAAGDLIVVKSRNAEEYKVGMIVTYQTDQMDDPVTHKIVKVENGIITTRGISKNNNTDDDPFDVKYVIGEVVNVWHGYAGFMNWIKSPLGIICIFFGCVIFIEGPSLIHKLIFRKNNASNKDTSEE